MATQSSATAEGGQGRRLDPKLVEHVRVVVASMGGNASALARIAGVDPKSVLRFLSPDTPTMEGPTIGKIVAAADLVKPRGRTIEHVHAPVSLDDYASTQGLPVRRSWARERGLRFEEAPQPRLTKVAPPDPDAPNPPPRFGSVDAQAAEIPPAAVSAPAASSAPPEGDPIQTVLARRCSTCGTRYPLTEEYFYRKGKGFRWQCIGCEGEHQDRRQREDGNEGVPHRPDSPALAEGLIDRPIIYAAPREVQVVTAPPIAAVVDETRLGVLIDRLDAAQENAFKVAMEVENIKSEIRALLRRS